jgi:hypothetical protein
VKTTNPETAGELLMKREYPEILNCEKEPHSTQFLPDCYLYGELIEKVKTKFPKNLVQSKLQNVFLIIRY